MLPEAYFTTPAIHAVKRVKLSATEVNRGKPGSFWTLDLTAYGMNGKPVTLTIYGGTDPIEIAICHSTEP